MTDYWPSKLDPRSYSREQRETIKLNERFRIIEKEIKKLKGKKK